MNSKSAHSKMGVGKKIKRIFSFKRKKEEKPAIEGPNEEKPNHIKSTSSLISLGRRFSFGNRDKSKKDRSKKGAPPPPEPAVPVPVAAAEPIATIPLATPKTVVKSIAKIVPAAETSKPKIEIEPAVKVIKVALDKVAVEQQSASATPLFEKVKPPNKQEDIKDKKTCGDGVKLATGQADSLSEEQSDKPATTVSNEPEKHCAAPTPAVEEPKTITEVINKIHDKTETNQTGKEFVRTVETEQERTLAEDGNTVISQLTKTTTTTVDRAGVGNKNQVETEIKKEVMPRVSNGHSRQTSQLAVQTGSKLPLQLLFAFLTAALAFAILYRYKDLAV